MILSDFLAKYKPLDGDYALGARFATMCMALSLLHYKKSTNANIVETGTTRKHKINCPSQRERCGDGCATVLFGDYVSVYGGQVWTCDISRQAIEDCRIATLDYREHITYHIQDSLQFLSEFDKPIDFLYLDSVDGHNPLANEHQLSEIKTVLPKLTQDTIILLDDLGSKTQLSIPFLLDNNYCQILLDIKQPNVDQRLCQGLFVHKHFLY